MSNFVLRVLDRVPICMSHCAIPLLLQVQLLCLNFFLVAHCCFLQIHHQRSHKF